MRVSVKERDRDLQSHGGSRNITPSASICKGKGQLARYICGLACSTFADRLVQFQLFSFVVLSGPGGEGQGDSMLSLMVPFVLFSFAGGWLGDRFKSREVMVGCFLARAGLLVIAPSVFIETGATGAVIPAFVFALSALIAISSGNSFAMVRSIADRISADQVKQDQVESSPLRTAGKQKLSFVNALASLAACVGTLLALCLFQRISDLLPPVELLRLSVAPYIVAGLLFVGLADRPTTKKGRSNWFKGHARQRQLYWLCAALNFVATAYMTIFTVLTLQNTDLNGALAINIFALTAAGFIIGCLVYARFCSRSFQPLKLLLLSTSAMAAILSVMSAIGAVSLVQPLYFLIGAISAISLISTDTIEQMVIPSAWHGKSHGLIVALSAASIMALMWLQEPFVFRYSAFNLLRIMNLTGAVLLCGLMLAWPQLRSFVLLLRRRSHQ